MTEASVVDACVHHRWADQAEIMAYLSRGWRAFIGEPGSLPAGAGAMPILPGFPYHRPDGDTDAAATTDRPAGSCPATLREQLLDRNDLAMAVLVPDEAMLTPALPNTHLAREIARATNDWTIDRWLDDEPRLRGVVVVPNQVPEDAASEIARVGGHPQMAAVLMCANGLGKPFGHPAYHPIYRAAAEQGLPIVVHSGGDAISETLTDPTAGGLPATYAEHHVFTPQPLATHLVTLVAQGVFERFPDLRVVFAGGGATWLSALMWRFDTEYQTYRREAPWLRRTPGEYVREHIRLTTFPLESTPDDPDRLRRILAAYDGLEDLLVYGSGYPSWETDHPDDVARRLPAGWAPKVMRDNAVRLFTRGATGSAAAPPVAVGTPLEPTEAP